MWHAHAIALLRPIACRMRQRPLMIIEPTPIAQIDIAAAQRAAFECLASVDGGPPICLPITVPRGRGSSIFMIVVVCCLSKNMTSESLPRPSLMGHVCKVGRLVFRFDGRYQYRRGTGYCEVGYISDDRLPFRRCRNSLQSVGTLKV
jgi:hypothetical protein